MSLTIKRAISLVIFFTSQIFLVVVVSLIDWWINKNWGEEATISRAIKDAPSLVIAIYCFAVGFVVGGLMFHFFFPQPPMKNDPYLVSEKCATIADQYVTSDSHAREIAKEIRSLRFPS